MTEALLTTAVNGIIRYTVIWYLLESVMMPVGKKGGEWLRLARWLSITVIECLMTGASYLAAGSSGWFLFIELLFMFVPQIIVVRCFADGAFQAPVIQKINIFFIFYIITGGLADLYSEYYVDHFVTETTMSLWGNATYQGVKSILILLILLAWYLNRKHSPDQSLLNARLFLMHFFCLLFLELTSFSLYGYALLILSFLATVLLGRIEKLSLMRQIEEQKQQQRIQEERIRHMKEVSQQQSWLRHDLRNLLTSVQVLMDQGQKEEALRLLDQIEVRWQSVDREMASGGAEDPAFFSAQS